MVPSNNILRKTAPVARRRFRTRPIFPVLRYYFVTIRQVSADVNQVDRLLDVFLTVFLPTIRRSGPEFIRRAQGKRRNPPPEWSQELLNHELIAAQNMQRLPAVGVNKAIWAVYWSITAIVLVLSGSEVAKLVRAIVMASVYNGSRGHIADSG